MRLFQRPNAVCQQRRDLIFSVREGLTSLITCNMSYEVELINLVGHVDEKCDWDSTVILRYVMYTDGKT
jgi:hypothetical protein